MGGVKPIKILETFQPAMEFMGSRFEKVKKKKGFDGHWEGDIHDIGKNIVSFMLDVSGYDVLDLGNDVPINLFI